MKITLEYGSLTVTIDAMGMEASIDSIMIASAVLDKTTQLKYGNPKVKMDLNNLKEKEKNESAM